MQPPPIFNPMVPYLQVIPGGFPCGRMLRIQGTVPVQAFWFAVNLQCGPAGADVALRVNPRFQENHIARNTMQKTCWGAEETYGPMPLLRGQPFEMLILCEPRQFKIAVNGQHFADYPHRIPYEWVSHLGIEGDVVIARLSYEGATGLNVGPPPPIHPHGIPPTPPYPLGPAPPYPSAGTYPPQPGTYPAYPASHGPPGYPPPPTYPGHGHAFGPGALTGTAVGAGLAGSAFSHLSPKKAAKKKKKMAKKALKYGIPIAGVGLGAYALSKGFHHSSSSSSSSSSSEEEE